MTLPPRLSRPADLGPGPLIPAERLERLRALEKVAFGGRADPDDIYDAGTGFLQLGDYAQAAAALREAARLKPGFAHARLNLGIALHQLGRADEAIEELRQAAALAPDDAKALGALAMALEAEGKLREAALPRLRLARLDPDSPAALVALGHLLERTGRYRAAHAIVRRAVDLDPADPQAIGSLGVTLYGLGRLAEARAALDRALDLKPDNPRARYARAFTRLKAGDLEAGWRDWEARLQTPEAPPWMRALTAPRWDGEPAPGATVLLAAEQGLGDTLQMARYADQVRARVGQAVLWVPPPLVRLLGGASQAQRPPPHDAWIPMFSLPALFGPLSPDGPAPPPYLKADPELVQRWSGRLPPGRPRIGAVWRGSVRSRVNVDRSFPAAALKPLAEACGGPLVSLQKDATAAELGQGHLFDLGEAYRAGDFADTAAIMQSLDLIVCCDTAAAHLAGALGRPVWVAVGANSDWRWLQDRSDTIWYPSMRLFRRSAGQSWHGLLAGMARELASA